MLLLLLLLLLLLPHFRRFLGWLKGYIHDRNHSSANCVRGYARATLARRAPAHVRSALLARYARNNVQLPPSSFLHNAGDRLATRRRPGGHHVELKLTRRNQKVVQAGSEPRLWRFLKKYVVDDRRKPLLAPPANNVHIIEILSKGKAAIVMNGQSVCVGSWFEYDTEFETVRVGKLERIFVVTFGARSSPAGREMVVFMRRFSTTNKRDDTDYDVDTGSNTALDVVPLKGLFNYMWDVERDDDQARGNPRYRRLLLVKDL